MALSQDEQRMLAEIERRLVADDPGLASCLTTFRRPGPATVLRSPRARIVGSLFTVLLVAMVSLMVYAMIPFRAHMLRHTPPPATTAAPANTTLSDATSGQPNRTQQSSAGSSTGAKSTASQATTSQAASSQGAAAGQTATSRSAAVTSTTTGKSQQAKVNPTNTALLPEASP
jgi:cytoskeletal protein RodZ